MSPRDPIRIAYEFAGAAYARKFIHELDDKPFDREALQEFGALVGPERPVLHLGCGPGHTTALLTSLWLAAAGVDGSPAIIEISGSQARFDDEEVWRQP